MQIAQFSSRTFGRNTPSLTASIPLLKSFASDHQRTMTSLGRTSNLSSGYLKQTDEWLMAAQESTENFKTHGSRLPVVWVLTEGNRIPPSAVPFDEDANGPLYIARAFLEGHLYLGRAGPQLPGGVFTYAGRELMVSNYEILVFCASLLHWDFTPLEANNVLQQGTVVLAQQYRLNQNSEQAFHSNVHMGSFNTDLCLTDILRYIPNENRIDVMKKLEGIKTVVLIDDSISMSEGNLWIQALEAIGGIADIANRHGARGVDLHFMHRDGFGETVHSRDDVARLFGEVQPDGYDTPTGTKLARIFERYLPLIEARASTHGPITVIVITNSITTDHDVLVQCIADTVLRLERSGVKEDMFSIQFVQIGKDVTTAESLRALDFNPLDTDKIRNIVTATPFSPGRGVFDTEYILKILFGSNRNETERIPNYNSQPAFGSPGLESGQISSRVLVPASFEEVFLPELDSPTLARIPGPTRGSAPLARPQRRGLQDDRWSFSDQVPPLVSTLHSSGGLQDVSGGYRRETAIKALAETKTVILIEDSISVTEGSLWWQAKEAIGGLVDIASHHSNKGIDLHFMHHDGIYRNLQSRDDVTKAFDQVQPMAENTPTGTKLAQLIEYYLPFIESKESVHEPITIMVLTNGEASDYDILVLCIVETTRRLERGEIKEDRFGIQFVQIGRDAGAARALRALDLDLERTYKIKNIVHSSSFDPDRGVFNTEYMLNNLVRSIHKTLDDVPDPKFSHSSLSRSIERPQDNISWKTSILAGPALIPPRDMQKRDDATLTQEQNMEQHHEQISSPVGLHKPASIPARVTDQQGFSIFMEQQEKEVPSSVVQGTVASIPHVTQKQGSSIFMEQQMREQPREPVVSSGDSANRGLIAPHVTRKAPRITLKQDTLTFTKQQKQERPQEQDSSSGDWTSSGLIPPRATEKLGTPVFKEQQRQEQHLQQVSPSTSQASPGLIPLVTPKPGTSIRTKKHKQERSLEPAPSSAVQPSSPLIPSKFSQKRGDLMPQKQGELYERISLSVVQAGQDLISLGATQKNGSIHKQQQKHERLHGQVLSSHVKSESFISTSSTNASFIIRDYRRELAVKMLSETKTVFLVDELLSATEGNLFLRAREAIAGFVEISANHRLMGVDIHLVHQNVFAENILSVDDLAKIFAEIEVNGADAPTGLRLAQLIECYLPLIESEESTHPPITIIVMSGSVPTDPDALVKCIVGAAQRLDKSSVRPDVFGIQFIQMGTGVTKSVLRILGDDFGAEHNVREIVATASFNPAQGTFDSGFVIDILLGGIWKLFGTKSVVQSALGPLSNTGADRTSILVSATPSGLEQEPVSPSSDQASPALITTPVTALKLSLVLTDERQEQPWDQVSSSDGLTNRALISRRATQMQGTSTLSEQQKLAQPHERISLSDDLANPASIAPHVAAVEQGTLALTEEMQEQTQNRISSSDDLTNLALIASRATQIQGTSTLAEPQKLAQSHGHVPLPGDQATSALIPSCVTWTQEKIILTGRQMQEQAREQASSVWSESVITTSSTSAHFFIQNSLEEVAVKTLSATKLVFLVDESLSVMERNPFLQAREAIAGLVEISANQGLMGVDVHLLLQDVFAENILSVDDLTKIFAEVNVNGTDTLTGAKFAQLIERYLPLIESKESTHPPIAIIVMSGSVPTDPDTLVNCIVSAAQRLDMSGARLDMFGVQFIQMGTEDDTKSILRILGDDFGVKHNVGEILTTTSFNPTQATFNFGCMIEILLGGIWKHFETTVQSVPVPPSRLAAVHESRVCMDVTPTTLASPPPDSVQTPLTPSLAEKALLPSSGSLSLDSTYSELGSTHLQKEGIPDNQISFSGGQVPPVCLTVRSSGNFQYDSGDYQRETAVETLAATKIVILVDDSMAMSEGNIWHQAKEAVGGLIDVDNRRATKGVDLHFMHHEGFHRDLQSRNDVMNSFDLVQPLGKDTPTGATLARLIEYYLPFVEVKESTHEPITIIVITSGEASDHDTLVDCILQAAGSLARGGVHEHRFGIQIVQIGTNPAAADALGALRADLEGIGDIVYCTPCDPVQGVFDTEYIVKAVFGRIRTTFNDLPSDKSPRIGPMEGAQPWTVSGTSASSVMTPPYDTQSQGHLILTELQKLEQRQEQASSAGIPAIPGSNFPSFSQKQGSLILPEQGQEQSCEQVPSLTVQAIPAHVRPCFAQQERTLLPTEQTQERPYERASSSSVEASPLSIPLPVSQRQATLILTGQKREQLSEESHEHVSSPGVQATIPLEVTQKPGTLIHTEQLNQDQPHGQVSSSTFQASPASILPGDIQKQSTSILTRHQKQHQSQEWVTSSGNQDGVQLIAPHVTQKPEASICAEQQKQQQTREEVSSSSDQDIPGLMAFCGGQEQGSMDAQERQKSQDRISSPSPSVESESFISTSNISRHSIIQDYLRESTVGILSETKIVFLVDESLSVTEENLLLHAREAIAGFVEISANQGLMGVDVHLLHQAIFSENILSVDDLMKLFAEVHVNGTDTPTGARLAQLIDQYLPLIEFKESTYPPITIIVMSGSVPTDPDTVVECIIDAAQRLDNSNVRRDMFGVQFIQMCVEEDTESVLSILGDDFGAKHDVREIVATTSFNSARGTFDSGFMIKILLEGIRKVFETKFIVRSALHSLSSTEAARMSIGVGVSLPRLGQEQSQEQVSPSGDQPNPALNPPPPPLAQIRGVSIPTVQQESHEQVSSLEVQSVSVTATSSISTRFITSQDHLGEAAVNILSETKIVFLVDEYLSVTAGDLFLQAREAIAGIVEISGSHGLSGVDLHLLHQDVFAENVVFAHDLMKIFAEVQVNGTDTPTGARLTQLIEHYIPLVDSKESTHPPIIIIVMSGSVSTDPDTLVECIVSAATRLDNSGVGPDVFGIQFIQLDVDDGTKSAPLLDDFGNKYNVREIATTTSFNPAQGAFDYALIINILLESIRKLLWNQSIGKSVVVPLSSTQAVGTSIPKVITPPYLEQDQPLEAASSWVVQAAPASISYCITEKQETVILTEEQQQEQVSFPEANPALIPPFVTQNEVTLIPMEQHKFQQAYEQVSSSIIQDSPVWMPPGITQKQRDVDQQKRQGSREQVSSSGDLVIVGSIPSCVTQKQGTSICTDEHKQEQSRENFTISGDQACPALIPPHLTQEQGTSHLTEEQKLEQYQEYALSSRIQSEFFVSASSIGGHFITQDYLRDAVVNILSETKMVFLIDESLSVTEGNLFFETRKAIAGIIEICGTQGFRGVDIHLLHQDVLAENIVSVDDLTKIFAEVQINGTGTPIGARIGQLIDRYLPLIESVHTPTAIFVVSGSVPSDPDILAECIVHAAQRLDQSGAQPNMFGIQFIQIGTEEVSKDVLRILGDDFRVEHNVRGIVTTTSLNPAQCTFCSGFIIEILLRGIRKLFGTKSIVQSPLGPLSSTTAAYMSIRVSVTPSGVEQEEVSPSGDQANPASIAPHVTAVEQGTLALTEERQEQSQDRISFSDDSSDLASIASRVTQIQGTSTLAEEQKLEQPHEQVSLSGDHISPALIVPHAAAVEQGTLVLTEIQETSTLAKQQKLAQSHEQLSLSGDQASLPSIVPHVATVEQGTLVLTEERQEQSQDQVSSTDDLTNLSLIAPCATQIQGTSTPAEQQELAQPHGQVSLSGDRAIPASIIPHVAAVKRGTLVLAVEEGQEQPQNRVLSSDDLTNLPSIAPRVTKIQGTPTLLEQQKLAQFYEQVSLSGDQARVPASIAPHVTTEQQGTLVLTVEERQERPWDRVSYEDDLTNLPSISLRVAQTQGTSTLVEQQKPAQSQQVSLSGDQAIPASITPHVAAVKQGTLVLTEERQEQPQDRISSSDDLTNLASVAPRVTQLSTLVEQQGLAQPHEQVSLSGDQAISTLIPPCVTRTQESLILTGWQMQGLAQERVSSVRSESVITTSISSAHFFIQDSLKEAAVKTLSETKLVFLVDESLAVTKGNIFLQATEAIAGFVEISANQGLMGVDVHLLHQAAFSENILSVDDLTKLFAEVHLNGWLFQFRASHLDGPEGTDTPTGARLAQLTDQYLPLIESKESTHPPITIIVMSDSVPTDPAKLVECIVDAAHRLDMSGVRPDIFGIQFIQMSMEEVTNSAVHILGDSFGSSHNVREIVATSSFNYIQGRFDFEYMMKILLGGICRKFQIIAQSAPALLSDQATCVSKICVDVTPTPLEPAQPGSVQISLGIFTPPLSEKPLLPRSSSSTSTSTSTSSQSRSLSLTQPQQQGTLEDQTSLSDSQVPLDETITSTLNLQYTSGAYWRETAVATLGTIKSVILVDDSMPMIEGNVWLQAREAVEGLVDIVDWRGAKGVDLHFIHHAGIYRDLQSRDSVAKAFDQVQPMGKNTPIGTRLAQLIKYYLPFIESKESMHEPITIMVLTNGQASDYDILVRCIVETARRLERGTIKEDKFGVRFVQIGANAAAAEALGALRVELEGACNFRDIVGFTTFDPDQGTFDIEYILNVLFGHVYKTRNDVPTSDNLQHSLSLPRLGPMPATLSWEALASSSLIPPWATQNQDTSIPGLQTHEQPRQRFSFSDVQAISTLIPPRISYNQGILVTKQRKQELSEQVCDIQQPSTFVLTKRQQQEQSKGQFLSSSNQSKTFMAAKSSISSRFIIKDYLRESAAKIMSESMTVFLVDEALSVAEGNLFLQAREAIAGIVEICANQGFRGVDVHLLHQDVFAENILSVDDLTEIFAEVQFDGTDAPTGARLAQLIERYLPLIESKESTHPPINIIVMSGSVPTDPDTLVECIVDAAQRLDMSGVRPDMFGIQFAQMGAEEVTNQVLRILGDNFGARNNVREIVTTISFDPAQGTFDSSFMIKILLGGIRKLFETKAIVQSALVPLSNRISSQATNISKALGSAPTTNLNLTGGFGRPLGKFPRF